MKILSLFLIPLVTLYCCRNSPKLNNIPVDADLVAAFNYQPGTYWIYKDSLTGVIDSFYVTENNTSAYINSGAGYSVGEIVISVVEYNTNTSAVKSWALTYQGNMLGLKYFENTSKDHYISYIPLINYPFSYTISICNYCLGWSSGIGKVNNIYNSYVVIGNSFSNVAEVNNAGTASLVSLSDHNDWFYITSSAGIIKIKLNHPQDSLNRIWELVRYNIVK